MSDEFTIMPATVEHAPGCEVNGEGWCDCGAIPPGAHCGRDCACCEYDDGTAPCDHERDCALFKPHANYDPVCSCDGADERAAARKAAEQ